MKIKFTKKDKRTNLEKEIDQLIQDMRVVAPNSESYSAMAENLEKLCKANSYKSDRHISPDTLAVVAGNLIGIGLILNHERLEVISSKALGFVLRGRV